MSLHKNISCLRSIKVDEANFFTHLIHFLYQNLEQFPQVSICAVSKIQLSNGVVSSYRLLSKIGERIPGPNSVGGWVGHRASQYLLPARNRNPIRQV
jgi:hypothetical protein